MADPTGRGSHLKKPKGVTIKKELPGRGGREGVSIKRLLSRILDISSGSAPPASFFWDSLLYFNRRLRIFQSAIENISIGD